jgi:outer membrane protein assembly factor BamB
LCDAAGANCADIAGATDPTYVPSSDDYGATLRVRVVGTNGVGSSAPVESDASAVLVSTAPPVSSTAPVVSGDSTVSVQLSTTDGTWANSATSYAYQWQRCDDTGSNCVDIPGATSPQYTLVPDDAGSEIRSEVLASNPIGPASGYVPSAPTAVVVEIGTPTISTSPGDQATAYQLDSEHDGYMADAGLAAPLTQAWSDNFPDSVWYSLIVNGTVFITTGNKMVYALNQATGSTIWSHAVGGVYTWSGLTYDRGRVFVLDSSGVLTAFDATSGSVAWSEQLPGQYGFLSPPTARNGIVYATGDGAGGTVYAAQEGDGHLLWTLSGNFGATSSPAVSATGLYVSSGCQETWGFDPVLGAPLWHFVSSCVGGGGLTPVVANGHVFVNGTPLGSVVLSSSSGAPQGSFNPGPAPAVANGVAFMLEGSTLSAVGNAGLGDTQWTFTGDGKLDTAPIVVGGLVIVGSSAGNVYALDAATGATSWSTSVGAPVPGNDSQSFAAANGTLLVSAGSQLVAYRNGGAISDVPSNQSPPTVGGPPDLSGIEAADVGIWSGLPSAYTYQWELCDSAGANCADIAGATGQSYTPPPADVAVGDTLRVKVAATNDVGSSDPVESAPSVTSPLLLGSASSSSSAQVRNGSRRAAVGQQLATTDGIWTDDPTSYQFKWQRCDYNGYHCADIAGATGSQYTVVSADNGHAVRSKVRAINAVGAAATYVPSADTRRVGSGPKPAFVSAPAVSGRTAIHAQLSTTNGTWSNGPTSYQYRWQRCTATGVSCVNIANATSSHYTLVVADVGHRLRSEVLASNGSGPAATGYAPSVPTSVVVNHKPVVITLPKLSGVPIVGTALKVTTGTWKYWPASYAYQWILCTPASCKPISGAKSSSYVLGSADVGYRIKATVTAMNAIGSATVFTSNTSAKVHR